MATWIITGVLILTLILHFVERKKWREGMIKLTKELVTAQSRPRMVIRNVTPHKLRFRPANEQGDK